MDIDIAVARLLEDGSPDEGFGASLGRFLVYFDFGGTGNFNRDTGFAIGLQGDHGILVAGIVNEGASNSVLGIAQLYSNSIHVDGFESGDTSGWTETVP